MKRSCLLLFALAARLPAAAQRIDRSAAGRHAVGRADTTRYGAARAEAAEANRYAVAPTHARRYAAEPTDAPRSDSVEHAGLTAAVESLLSAADRLASIADSLRTTADSLRALESPAPTAACVADAAIARAAAELPAATAGIPSDEEFRRTRQRFLPMRRRMDREIGKLKYAYKGELIMGFTASYGTLSSDETDFWLVLDNINASGTIATVKPFFGYFYRDNNCFGIRFGYRKIDGSLGNLGLDLGDKNDISFSIADMDLSSSDFSVGLFHRSYAGLDPKGRFGLFAELDLSYATGTSRFTYKSGDETRYTRSKNAKLKLAFNPGVAVYIFPNVCGTLSFGLGGLQYGRVRQFDEAGNKTGSRTASKMRFRLNLADINIGMVIHLWDKKKE